MKSFARDKLLPRLQQHDVIAVSFQFGSLVGWYGNRFDGAHGWGSLATVDGVLLGEIREKTIDPQQSVSFSTVVGDCHQERDVPADLLDGGKPRL